MLGVHSSGKRRFESINVRAANKGAVANDQRNSSVNITLDSLILEMKVRVGYRHQKNPRLSLRAAPKYARRISGVGARHRDILCYNGTRADHYIVADSHRQNGGI